MRFPSFVLALVPGWLALGATLSADETTVRAPAQTRLIASDAWAGSSINVVANIRSALFTDPPFQYAAYYDGDGFMVLARRSLDADVWTTRRTVHRGNVADAHNSISLAVDGAGHLHVAWDHHGNPLNYARSVAPASLELEPPAPMTGERESRVTYPQFFRQPDGDLLFLYRDGQSGRGSLVLNRYHVATRAWSSVQANLIDGENQRSPYWGLAVDVRGTLHLAWIWRDSGDVASNHDLAYARSTDGGQSWTRSDGQPVALPLTASNCEYAARIPTHRNLMNSPFVAADDAGRPHLLTYWSPTPGAPPQFQIVHHDGQTWKTTPVDHPLTAFSLAGTATKRPPISRGVLLLESPGARVAAHLVYRDDSQGGRVIAVSTDDLAFPAWRSTPLTLANTGAWEPAEDPVAWSVSREFSALVQTVRQLDGNDRQPAPAPPTPIASLHWRPTGETPPASAAASNRPRDP